MPSTPSILGQGSGGAGGSHASLVEAGRLVYVAPVFRSRKALGGGRKVLRHGWAVHRLAVARGQHARFQRSHLFDGSFGGVPIWSNGCRRTGDLLPTAQHAPKRVGVHGG